MSLAVRGGETGGDVLLKAVQELDYGDVLAVSVLGPEPDPFLPAGQVVGPTALQALQQAGASRVYVEEPRAIDIEISDVVSPMHAKRSIRAIRLLSTGYIRSFLLWRWSAAHPFGAPSCP